MLNVSVQVVYLLFNVFVYLLLVNVSVQVNILLIFFSIVDYTLPRGELSRCMFVNMSAK